MVQHLGNFPPVNATANYECFGEHSEISNNVCTNENVGTTAISLQITVTGGAPTPPPPAPPTPPAQCVDQNASVVQALLTR